MVRIKDVAEAARDIIDSSKRGVPYSISFGGMVRMGEKRIVLTADQWKVLEDVLKEHYDRFVKSWIIPPARRILELIGEEDEETPQ